MKRAAGLAVAIGLAAAWVSAQTAPPRPASAVRPFVSEVALANRILSNEGVLDAYGHVSVRSDRDASHFFLSRNMPPALVTPADIVEYDLDSKPVLANAPNGYTERFIHGEIYRARPDVMAVVHTHAPDLVTFSASTVPLLPISHMAGFLGGGVPKFEIRDAGGTTDMLIRSPELARALAKTLGDRPAALMRGHGAVVVAPNLHVVVGRAYYMALNARLQQQVILLGGQVTYLEPEEAQKAGAQDGFERAWTYWKARAAR